MAKNKIKIKGITNRSRFMARRRGVRDSRSEALCSARIEGYRARFERFKSDEYARLEASQRHDRERSAELVSLIRDQRKSLAVPLAPLPEGAPESDRKNHTRKQMARAALQRSLSAELTELSRLNEQIAGRQAVVRARVEKGYAIFRAFINAYLVGVFRKNKDFSAPDYSCGNGLAEYLALHAENDNERRMTLNEGK